MKNVLYQVMFGSWTAKYEGKEDAEEMCLEWAREEASEEGIDPEDIEIYGGPGIGAWGACPSNNDGAYYPVIKAVRG